MISLLHWLLLFAVLLVCPASDADAALISKSCKDALNTRLPGWQLATVTRDAAEWAKEQKFDPVFGTGDFDGDGRDDEAIIIQHAGQTEVAVCLATASGTRLVVIEKPYCSDYVSISKAGSKHYNYDTEKIEVIKKDGISVSCYGQAGATYLYEGKGFRQLVDSD